MENLNTPLIPLNNTEKKGKKLFQKGMVANPKGRPIGSKNKCTILRDKLLAYALEINLDAQKEIMLKGGLKAMFKEIPNLEILKLAAGFVPKEIKGEGFAGDNITTIFSGEQIEAGERRELIDALRARRSEKEPA